jgi:hypothetical protein
MNFANFVSIVAIIFAVGCSTSTETPVSVQETTDVVVEPVSVEVTPVVNEAPPGVSTDTTLPVSNTVSCPEGSTLVDGACHVTTSETQTSSH